MLNPTELNMDPSLFEVRLDPFGETENGFLKNCISNGWVSDIAPIIRRTPDALKKSCIIFSDFNKKSYWHLLLGLVPSFSAEDGPVVFKAMEELIPSDRFVDRAVLMKAVLSAPSWGPGIIRANPDFFFPKRMSPTSGRMFHPEQCMANAFQILASIDTKNLSCDETRQTIQALKSIGLDDNFNPDNGNRCMHEAVSRSPEMVRAFIQEFPWQLEIENFEASRPLHYAARASGLEVVKMLLEEGVEPRPVNRNSATPLYFAGCGRSFKNAMILIESGAYTDDDLQRLSDAARTTDAEVIQQLKALHLAVKARNVIDGAGENTPLPSPL